MLQIIPSIIAKSYDEFSGLIKKVEPFAKRVHVDIMDGEFVANETVKGYDELKRFMDENPDTSVWFEVHLMVNNPEGVLYDWMETKADKILVHWESTQKFGDAMDIVKTAGKQFAAVLNPETGIEVVDEHIKHCDTVQFMTVNPGFYGSPFLPEVAEKIKKFHAQYPQTPIEVDGGITPETIKPVTDAGAELCVVGSYIMKSDDPQKAFNELLQAVSSK